ncbi:MAG: T9SS type A sorting domain-containing protein [Bacteroidota bacterium]
MKKVFTLLTTLTLLFTFPSSIVAQDQGPGSSSPDLTLLFEEDFSTPGLPSGWFTVDMGPSNLDVLWEWCEDSSIDGTGACPKIWDGVSNQQSAFAATSASTGFLVAESFKVGDVPHLSVLNMPVQDFSDQDEVWIHFQTHIGGFIFDPATNAIVSVSTDGINWEAFTCFPNQFLEDGVRWSINPEHVYLDISSIAANQETVFIQWSWRGNDEYYWAIDDLQVYDGDPRPANDLRVSREWFALAPSETIPTSQVTPFGFMADIVNRGIGAQSDVKEVIDIYKAGVLVHTDTLFFDSIAPGQIIENQVFPNTFTPSGPANQYLGVYSVIGDSQEATPFDNEVSFNFSTSDSTFAKESYFDESVTPGPEFWPANAPHSWSWGNFYFLPNGEGYRASSASFSIFNGDSLEDKVVFIHLYEWIDANENTLVEAEERTLVGQYNYTFGDDDPPQNQSFVTVPLYHPNTQGEVLLKDNTAYLLMLEYETNDQKDLVITCNRRNNYEAMIAVADSLNQPFYASMLAVAPSIVNATYEPIGFGENYAPGIRLNIDLITSTNNLLSKNNLITTFPNPAIDELQVALQFVETMEEVQLSMLDTRGTLLRTRQLENIKEETVQWSTQALSAGIYFLKVETAAGNRSQRFIVAR